MVQYRTNPRKNFFTENKKGGEKFPWAFSPSKQCSKKKVKNYKKLEKQ